MSSLPIVLAEVLDTELNWSQTLSTIFSDLRLRTGDARIKAVEQLKQYVAEASQEMKGEYFATFMHDVNNNVKELTKSSISQDVLAGILSLNYLMDVEYDLDDGAFATEWSIYLRTAIHQSDSISVAEEASKCLGRLARIYQGTLPRESIDFEVREAIEWLSIKDSKESAAHPHKRQTAVYVLAELIKNVPNLVNLEHVESFLDIMAGALHSPNQLLRTGTVEVLRWSLRLIKVRFNEVRTDLYQKTYAVVETGLQDKTRTPDSMHGSLMVVGVLLSESGTFMNDKYQRIMELLLQLRTHKSDIIRRAIIQLVPKLARYNPDVFATDYLPTWTLHLVSLAVIKKPERSVSLKALGQMATEIGPRVKSQLDKIMNTIIQSFMVKGAPKVPPVLPPEIFECISALAQAIGEEFEPHIAPLLTQMFATEFSHTLVDTLGELAKNIPTLAQRIQDSLLNVISLILAKEPYSQANSAPTPTQPFARQEQAQSAPITSKSIPIDSSRTYDGADDVSDEDSSTDESSSPYSSRSSHPSTPISASPSDHLYAQPNNLRHSGHLDSSSSPKLNNTASPKLSLSLPELTTPMGAPGGAKLPNPYFLYQPPRTPRSDSDINLKILALNTLATFDFDAEATKHLIHRIVVNYLEHENAVIRKRAVIACGKLLRRQGELRLLRGSYAVSMTTYVLQRLIRVSMTDLDSTIRITVLESFDKMFDNFLAQPDFLKAFFLFLYDESLEIRELATRILGRLAKRNPGYIFPTIRKVLLEFITASSSESDDVHKKESNSKLLGLTIRKFPRIARPYVESLIKQLVDTIRANQSPRLCAYSLLALGDLAEVAGEEMLRYNNELLPLVIDNFQDQSSASKRDSALKALSQIIVNTGFVIEPLIMYPKLLDTILNKIKREDTPKIRCELVRLLGIVGAVDPYKHKMLQLTLLEDDNEKKVAGRAEEIMKGVSLNSDDYYPAVALSTLIKFLRNPYGSLAQFQPMVVQSVMTIFKSLGIKSTSYLRHFMPLFTHVMKVCGDTLFGLRELVFQQLCVLVSIIKHYTRDYLGELFQMINEYWDHPRLTMQIVMLVEEISVALGDEFRGSIAPLIPKMLHVLQKDQSPSSAATIRILHALDVFGETIDDFMHLIVPAVLALLFPQSTVPAVASVPGSLGASGFSVNNGDGKVSPAGTPRKPIGYRESTLEVKTAAVQCIGKLAKRHDLSKFSVAIMHPLTRLLDKEGPLLGGIILDTLSAIALNLGQEYQVFARMIHSVMTKHQISDQKYNSIVYSLMRGESLPDYLTPTPRDSPSQTRASEEIGINKPVSTPKAGSINNQVLSSAWDTSRCFTKTDWFEWTRKLSIALLSESSSPALRSCAALAKAHYPVARELFNAGFISCWNELPFELQRELTTSLETALSSQNIPPEILQILLDLAEFMEHNEKALPIDIKTLAALATKCHAYAKALYYKETEFRQVERPTDANLIEDIISINYQLQLHEAAQGLLKYAQETNGVDVKVSWFEKLKKWSIALAAYDQQQIERPEDVNIMLGRMRCLHDLGNWDQLSKLAAEVWVIKDSVSIRTEIASLALSAALNVLRFDLMDRFIDGLPEHTLDGSFYRALISVHKDRFSESKKFIMQSRELAATELTALIGESYSRAYSIVVRIQQLAELEEIVSYKQSSEDPEKRQNILELWKKRLQGVERNVEVWQQLLSVRSLVEPPNHNVIWWTKFGNLVRKSDRPRKSRTILSTLLVGQHRELAADEPIPDNFPMVKYSYLNLLWTHTDLAMRGYAFAEMERWSSQFQSNSRMLPKDKAKCIAKLARWQLKMQADIDEAAILKITGTAQQAIEYAPEWYRAWHVWAIVNYKFIGIYEKQNSRHPKIDSYLVPAITGFIKSIALAPYDNLQDLLRLLTLWFKYGAKKEVEAAMKDGFDVIHVDKWLTVIPQLMARIHISLRSVRQGIHNVLTNLGKVHPQALVFPLTVAKQSPFPTRVTAAQSIMTSLRQFSTTLLDETLLVSTELIRVAILWKEKFYKGLDEASRYYYIEKKTDAMALVLQRLNEILERGAETMSEQTFVKAFGKELIQAWDLTKDFLKTNKVASINQAWELYGHVFRTIKRQLLTEFDKLHLKNVSPKLLEVKELALAVPGTYKAKTELVRIKSFSPVLKVISSKQQPRKLVINGTDGLEYPFLLKAHEDLRQDERVMQLFELVNTFLSLDDNTNKSHLNIRQFAVVPLSPNSGLIEWVPHCDTLHELIKHYRKTHNIPLDAEQLIIMRNIPIPEYYKLSPLQKLEIFESALDGSSGHDLQRVMYLTSKNSEEWIDKRTTYTRSLAVMSMVGYILGLGDRHPNNLLLNRNSGQIIHIDFGDCFEVAMHRDKFAEKVPFRLTRMVVNAMEVAGIRGTFRITSEAVMRVLRGNSDSIVAVLEAFVYDPLINWRLITTPFAPSPNDSYGDNGANPLEDDFDDDDDMGSAEADSSPSMQHSARNMAMSAEFVAGDMHDALNQRALSVIERVSNKLNGLDFKGKGTLDIQQQVALLLHEASSIENLCQAYLGWCPYW